MYPGREGAHSWLAVSREPEYPQPESVKSTLQQNRRAALRCRSFATVVSLGPGDGAEDLQFLKSWGDFAPTPEHGRAKLTYLPVDISRPLLEMAIGRLDSHAEVPLGVLCDFEADQEFLSDALERYATRPLLIALLGGTIGNLDVQEERFFSGIYTLMHPGDALLLDVPLAGSLWTAEREPRLNAACYTSACRRFLSQGLNSPARSDSAPIIGDSEAGAFEQAFVISLRRDAETGAEVIAVTNPRNGRVVLNRRYRWAPLLRWFENHGFRVEFAEAPATAAQDAFSMGVVLLTVS